MHLRQIALLIVQLLAATVNADCPGGSLQQCIALCPSTPAPAYKACVSSCVQRCPTTPTPPGPSQPTPAPPGPSPPTPSPPMPTNGSCLVYKQKSDNCANGCGLCFNAGARPGVMCKGSQPGYYCPSDNPPAGADMAFACMDWTFGSAAIKSAEAQFKAASGEDVYLGVGTYGTSSDAQRGLGACYRMKIQGVDKDIIAQSINTGSDVAGNQFDLQIGDGGAGAFNTCAGKNSSMYPGTVDAWGHQYGGVDNKAQCAGLPKYPQHDGPMKAAGDDLVSLCEYGFDKNVRGEGGANPTIESLSRVKCPDGLVQLTQIKRSDDPTSYKISPVEAARLGFGLEDHQCGLDKPGGTAAWCLTRMMDCRKPSGGFKDNIKAELVVHGHKLVQPCTSDGYTRIDVQCGCADCYC